MTGSAWRRLRFLGLTGQAILAPMAVVAPGRPAVAAMHALALALYLVGRRGRGFGGTARYFVVSWASLGAVELAALEPPGLGQVLATGIVLVDVCPGCRRTPACLFSVFAAGWLGPLAGLLGGIAAASYAALCLLYIDARLHGAG